MNIKIQCDHCDTTFERSNPEVRRSQRLGRRQFCSSECAALAKGQRMRITKRDANCLCAWCGQAFWKKPSSFINSKHEVYFCCRQHKDEAQRLGGIAAIQPPHYGNCKPEDSKSYKRVATEHHPKICVGCGYDAIPEILHVHHKDNDRSNSNPDNLEWRCGRCHDEHHFLTRTGKWC